MNLVRFTFCISLAILAFASGCTFLLHPINSTFARHSNPIEGWKSVREVGCKNGEMSAEISPIRGYETISDDVQKFVNKLPMDHFPDCTRRWCYWICWMRFYEDGTGQHAVSFTIPHDGTDWGYVLITTKTT